MTYQGCAQPKNMDKRVDLQKKGAKAQNKMLIPDLRLSSMDFQGSEKDGRENVSTAFS